MSKRRVVAVITDAMGFRVIVQAEALQHTIARHFPLFPSEIVLELIERILRDPTAIFEERKSHLFHLFYRYDRRHYIVVVIKRVPDGSYFVTAYPTGSMYRSKHAGLKRIHP